MLRPSPFFLAALVVAAACAGPPAEGEGEAGEGEGDAAAEGEGEGEEGEGEEGEGEAGEGEGEGEGDVGTGDLVINEISCRDDFVELKNVGSGTLDLSAFTLDGLPLAGGSLVAGGRVAIETAVPCGQRDVVLGRAVDVVVDAVHVPLLPRDASFARQPDGSGAFAAGAPTPNNENAPYVDAAAARLFLGLDDAVPAQLPELRIALTAASETALRATPDDYVVAEVAFEDGVGSVVVQNAGVRIKGQSVARTLDQKAAFRIDFDRFEPDEKVQHLFGLEKLVLNNLVQDNSATRERLYYGLSARNGNSASRVGYVKVFVNDVFFGVYVALESADDDAFLGRSFSSTQLLYEGEYGQDLFVGNELQFDNDFGTDDDSRSVLRHIEEVIDAAPGASFLAATSDVIAWDRLLPQLAVDFFCNHWDSYGPTKNNFTFHIDDDGRLALITGGADQAFSRDDVYAIEDGTGRLVTRCREDAACAAALDDAYNDVAADAAAWLAAGGDDRLTADAQTLQALFADDTRKEWNAGQIPSLVDDLVAFVSAQSATTR